MTLSSAEITKLLFAAEDSGVVIERIDALRASLVSAAMQMDSLLDNIPDITLLRDNLWAVQDELESIKTAIAEKSDKINRPDLSLLD